MHGVMLLLFDLPADTKLRQREYRRFRKAIMKEGYMAIQESVYVKLLRSTSSLAGEYRKIGMVSPENGNVFLLPMTLTQFRRMRAIRGNAFDFELFSDDIVCI